MTLGGPERFGASEVQRRIGRHLRVIDQGVECGQCGVDVTAMGMGDAGVDGHNG